MGNEKNITLFTGQSGISVKMCFERLNKELDDKVEPSSIERTMEEISGRSFKSILEENITYQYELWLNSFNKILNESDKDENLFITMHGVFYHQNTREFISPVDFERIWDLRGRVKSLIVFIDDIYDIYRRLLESDQMFNYVISDLTQIEAIYESIFNLTSILQWRQIEITVSRIISRILGRIPMFIVATKHPSFTVARLLRANEKELERYYLAHPISEVRENAKEQIPNFTGELNSFSKNYLKNESRFLFIPGTIDELRIKKENGQFIPSLDSRWPLPYGKTYYLNPLPASIEKRNPLNPKDFDIESSSEEVKRASSILLKLLWKQIYDQITSRDLSLVEFSKNGVIAYRPYFPYRFSGGVKRELEHNKKLKETELRRRNIIRSVKEDQTRARIHNLFNRIKSYVKDLDAGHKERLDEECDIWFNDPEKLSIFSNDSAILQNCEVIKEKFLDILPEKYKFIERVCPSK